MAISILAWVYLAKRQLRLDELQHALAVKSSDRFFDEDGIPSERSLLDSCLGLAVVEAETLTVRLTHFTLQEYLDKYWKEIFPSGHSDIATTCLTYLKFDHQGGSWWKVRATSPLIDYAVNYVGLHLRKGSNPALYQQMLHILRHEKKLKLLERALGVMVHPYRSKLQGFKTTALHWVAYFGITPIGKLLLLPTENYAINSQDIPWEKTALSYAAQKGHKSMVRELLSIVGVDINLANINGRTPLSYAAARGHEGTVKLLLDAENVNTNLADCESRTPLFHAATSGHEGTVRILLAAKGVDVNLADFKRSTPLTSAARNGCEAIVQLLLDTKGVDTRPADYHGRTVLTYAAANGWQAIVRMIFGREGVNADLADYYGRTPLSYAAELGHKEIVQIFLSMKCVDVDAKDNRERTPLSQAAGALDDAGNPPKHAAAIVQLLLDQSSVDPNSRDSNGCTPLFYAAVTGNPAAVQILLQRNVDLHHRDSMGQTAFSYTAFRRQRCQDQSHRERYDRVLQLLSECGARDTQALTTSISAAPPSLSEAEGQELVCNHTVSPKVESREQALKKQEVIDQNEE